MGLSLIINDVTDQQIAAIRSILSDTPADVAVTADPVKEKVKKSKKDKGEAIETTATDASDTPTEIHKEKALAKKSRDELISISEAMGIPEAETKGKRVNTLVSLILAKQEAITSAGSDGDDEDFAADDDDASNWDEDVPPADDDAPKKASKKDKKGKKGKKKK